MAGALLFNEKSAKGLHYFGLDSWMLEFFTHELSLPHFGAQFGGKDRSLCMYKPWSEQAEGLEKICI